MEILLTLLLWVLAILGILLAVLLVAPIQLAAVGALQDDRATFEARLRWALGLLGVDYRAGEGVTVRLLGLPVARVRGGGKKAQRSRRAKRRDKAKRAKKAQGAKKANEATKRKRGPSWAWRHRQTLWRAFLRLAGTLHLRGRLAGVVGLPEPDHTAWVAVALGQLARVLPEGAVDVAIDYVDETVDVSGRLSLWLVPAQVLAVGLALLMTRNVRRALRAT